MFITLNDDQPANPTPPPANLDDQEIVGQGEVQQGLLGLHGPVTPLKIELDTYFKMPPLPSAILDIPASLPHLHHLKGCFQAQAMWSSNLGVPWIQQSWI